MSVTAVVSRNLSVLLFSSLLYFLLLILLQRSSKIKNHRISFPFVENKCAKKQKILSRNKNDREKTVGMGKKKGGKLEKYNQIWKYEREQENLCMVILTPGITLGFSAYLFLIKMHPLCPLHFSKNNSAVITT